MSNSIKCSLQVQQPKSYLFQMFQDKCLNRLRERDKQRNIIIIKETLWELRKVKPVLKDRSYIVSTDGYDGKRNRLDIREWTCSDGEMMTNSEQNTSATSDSINSENQSIRRSSRTIKLRKRLIEEC